MTGGSGRAAPAPDAAGRLPVDEAIPSLREVLRTRGAAVLHAPTGAGKTTRVPLALLDSVPGQIWMLEPRRVAARAAARRMAETLGERVGQTVGYQVRFDREIGPSTRVHVMTEGVLLAHLVDDPFLEGVDVVILDEVHERGLDADLALALVRRVRADARPDLRVIAMSATADTDSLADFLDADVVRSEGRRFPVSVGWAPRPDDRPLPDVVRDAVLGAWGDTPGDVLVFLPGVGEIRRCAAALAPAVEAELIELHGRLDPDAQDRALRPGRQRRVILATNVAETSVTLPGVTAVVDSGLVRRARYDTGRGLDRLVTEPISRASADQRAGRAGRVAAGACVRLWTEASHLRRPAFDPPEITRVDLSRAVLQVLAFGDDPTTLRWPDAPPPHALQGALDLLDRLGATSAGKLTRLGRQLAALPAHPRVGALLVAGHDAGLLHDAALAAALLEDRLPYERTGPAWPGTSDLDDLFAAVRGQASRWRPRVPDAASLVKRTAAALAERARRVLPAPRRTGDDLAACLRAGWPDRVAARRPDGGVTLATGRGARVSLDSAVREADLLLALDVQDTDGADAVVHLGVALRVEQLPLTTVETATWEASTDRVITATERRYGALVVHRRRGAEVAPDVVAAALLDAARQAPVPPWPLEGPAAELIARLRFLARTQPALGLPAADDAWLFTLVPELAAGCRSLAAVREADWTGAIRGRLTWAELQTLDAQAPARLEVPSGSLVPVLYPHDGPPILAVRMQELFGCVDTPRVAGAPVRLHLLAPNGRPQQVTDDLAGFWQRTWPEVRKELRARYPKHAWPDDPTTAPPQRKPSRPR